MPVNLLNEKELNNYLIDIVYHGQPMETFKSGDFKSCAYVEQNKDAIVRSILLQWTKHRLRTHLADDLPEHKAFLTPISANEPNLPAWAENCLKEHKPIHRFAADKIPSRLSENIGMICDYLYSAAESYVNKTLVRVKDSHAKGKEDVTPKLRIDYLKTQDAYDTFEKTLTEAQKWHDIMAEKAALRKKNEAMYQASLAGTKSIMKLKDGMEIVQLTTPEALDYESEYMGHCVGKGGYDADVKKGTTKIYSLRDEDGMPHATFEVRINQETKKEEIHQCKGKGNKAPIEKYRPYIQEFVKQKNFEIVGDMPNVGLIRLYDEETGKSQLYNIFHIPKDKKFVCKGDLDLSDIGLTELPDLSNIKVEGNLDCSSNKLTSLKGAPQEVKGDFYCSRNLLTSLQYAPQEVGGSFYCTDNKLTSLQYAPQEVKGDFDCSRNLLTSLQYAPQTVGGSFYCSRNLLTSLQYAPQEVGGDFVCFENQLTSLQYAPQIVGGGFVCFRNQLTSLQYAPQEVGGDFYCSENQLTSLQYAPKKVCGGFDCSGNQLTSLQYAPQEVKGDFDCSHNLLTSLQYAPQIVGGGFVCFENQLTSLKGCSKCDNICADLELLQQYGVTSDWLEYKTLVNSPKWQCEQALDKIHQQKQKPLQNAQTAKPAPSPRTKTPITTIKDTIQSNPFGTNFSRNHKPEFENS